MNRKVLRICFVLAFIVTLCFSVFAEEFDISQFDMQKYEWYKEGDKWKCKKYGHDLIDVSEEIEIKDMCIFDAEGYEHGKYNMYFPPRSKYVWYKDEKGLRCKENGEDLINTQKEITMAGCYTFDENGYAKTGIFTFKYMEKNDEKKISFYYEKDLTPVSNEYILLNNKEYYTDGGGRMYRIFNEREKDKYHPKFYLDLDTANMDLNKARQVRDEETANEAAFLAFVDENTEKKTKLVFEIYKLGEFIENPDGTFIDLKTGDLIRNKAISYEYVEHNEAHNKDYVGRLDVLLDSDGNRVSGYYMYGSLLYYFGETGKHTFKRIVTDEKEKAKILAELDAKKNGYSIVSVNSSNNKPVFSEVEMPVAQDKSVVSEIEAPVAHTD